MFFSQGLNDRRFLLQYEATNHIAVCIISDTPKYAIIRTENSDVIDSFISEILKYEEV